MYLGMVDHLDCVGKISRIEEFHRKTQKIEISNL